MAACKSSRHHPMDTKVVLVFVIALAMIGLVFFSSGTGSETLLATNFSSLAAGRFDLTRAMTNLQ